MGFKQTVAILVRGLGVGLSAFLQSIHEATHAPVANDPRGRAAAEFFRTFTAAAKNVNAVCLRCGGRIHGPDRCWVRPDETGPAPGFYRFICDPCHTSLDAQSEPA